MSNNVTCDNSKVILLHRWIIFAAILFIFLFRDLMQGAFLGHKSATLGGVKELFAGTIEMKNTLVSHALRACFNY